MKYSKLMMFFPGFLLAVVLALSGCPSPPGDTTHKPDSEQSVTITFSLDYFGAPEIPSITIAKGSAASEKWPDDPIRSDGYTFRGWYEGSRQRTAKTIFTADVELNARWNDPPVPPVTSPLEDQPSAETLATLFSSNLPSNLSNSWKIWGHRNPLITQGFGADPTTMVYNDRVYLFASNDSLEYNSSGNPVVRTFSRGIQGLRVISSGDLSNWTDHGVIKPGGVPTSTNPLIPDSDTPQITPFETRTWAPSTTWKMVNGQPKFFLYFANSGDGIGVITADSPTGPWTSPLNKLLIDRDTPNCSSSDVEWLFDPGIFIDDDGSAYLYFGGGQTQKSGFNYNHTGYSRRVRLNDDMISLNGTPEDWNVPYMFEASDMFKYNGRYYFSYCTNWNTGSNSFGLSNSQIAYMTSTTGPMSGFGNPTRILNSASGQLSSKDDNNHQNIFVFKNNVYIAYHASKVAEAMMGTGNIANASDTTAGPARHRSSFIDKVTVNASTGALSAVTMTRKGVDQVGNLDPYVLNEAETIGIMGGIYTRAEAGAGNGMVVTSIDTGDWVAVYGVDFGSAGATKFTARVRTPVTAGYSGAIELRLDPSGAGVTSDTGNLTNTSTARITSGEVIGRAWLKAKSGEEGSYGTVTIDLNKTVTGVHNLVFVFYSNRGVRAETITRSSPHKNAFEFDQWQFFH